MLKEILKELIAIDEINFEIKMKANLSRSDYMELKHFLELLDGVYKTSGKKFVFKTNPKPLIDGYLKTGIMPKNNPTAFFPTPRVIVDDMIKLSDFNCLPNDEEYQSKFRALEPSGGVGGIADVIKEVAPFVQLDVVEILDINQEVLRQKGYEPICMDFMDYNLDYSIKYNYVLMNPPYQGKTFIKHIQHAFNMLESDGILAAVIPSSFLTQNDTLSKWLYEKVTQIGEVSHNPKNSFKDEGTNVDTCIIYLNKGFESWRSKEYNGCNNYWTWQVWLSLYTSGEVYCFLESLENDEQTKEKIKNMILNELEKYKKQYIYFSYEYLDDYVEKLYQHYCYMQEELYPDESDEDDLVDIEENEDNENIIDMTIIDKPFIYDVDTLNTFASGKLF